MTIAGVANVHEQSLTRREVAVLRVLMAHPSCVLSCRRLAEVVRDDEGSEGGAENLVRYYVHRLRQKIEPEPARPLVIRTVRGCGYMFDAVAVG